MNFVDVHSHVLPHIDDGSPDVETSVEMLRMWKKQGVDKIIATPHFDFRDISVEKFLEKRKRSFEELSDAIEKSGENLCDIELGAEIMYSSNMFGFVDISNLSLGETPYVLVEMADSLNFERMTDIINSRSRSDVTLILAHTERYKSFCFFPKLKKMRDADIRFQVNFSSFSENSPFCKVADAMMKADMIDLFGTDSHGIKNRTPDFSTELIKMRKMYGDKKIDRILQRSVRYFE